MTSMNEMPDNELDDLFRKSAEEADIPFDPEAWLRMEKKLDNKSPNGNNKWKRWGFLSLLLLLLISSGMYVWLSGSGDNGIQSNNPQENKEQKNTAILSDKIGQGNSRNDISEKGDNQIEDSEKADSQNGDKVIAKVNPKSNTGDSGKNGDVEVRDTDVKRDKNEIQKKNTIDDSISLPAEQDEKKNIALAKGGQKKNFDVSHAKTKNKTKVNESEEEQQPVMVDPIRTAKISRKKRTSLLEGSRKNTDKKLRRFFDPSTKPKDTESGRREEYIDTTEELEQVTTMSGNDKKIAATRNTKNKDGKTTVSKKNGVAANNEKPVIGEQGESTLEADIHTKRIYMNGNSVYSEQMYFRLLTGKPIHVDSVRIKELMIMPQVTETRLPVIKPQPEKKPFQLGIRFVVAPDLTTVGFHNFIQPGTSAGLIIEYNLTNRLLISAGGIYSKKLYVADGKDYKAPSSYLDELKKNGYYIKTIDADCRIIDIPVNLRYNIIQHDKISWFVNAGASSYLMKREDYNYHYYKNGYYGQKKWGISNSNNHFFAVGNLSVGYERRFSKQFSWQVEPYLKIPLGGVGFGKIKLISSGVFFSVKYHPFSRK